MKRDCTLGALGLLVVGVVTLAVVVVGSGEGVQVVVVVVVGGGGVGGSGVEVAIGVVRDTSGSGHIGRCSRPALSSA